MSAKVEHSWHRTTAEYPALLTPPVYPSTSPATAPPGLGRLSVLEKHGAWDHGVNVLFLRTGTGTGSPRGFFSSTWGITRLPVSVLGFLGALSCISGLGAVLSSPELLLDASSLRAGHTEANCCAVWKQLDVLATTSNGIQACFVLNQCRHTVLSCDCLEEKLGSYSQLVCWFNAWCQANNLIPLFPFTPCVWGLIILKIMWWKLLLCFEPCSKNHRNRKGRRRTVWDLNLILLPWICL